MSRRTCALAALWCHQRAVCVGACRSLREKMSKAGRADRCGEEERRWEKPSLSSVCWRKLHRRSRNESFDPISPRRVGRIWLNAETFVNFKSSLWMRPGWMRACFWTWLRYIRAEIWSCAAFTQNSDKLFLAASFPPSCLFYPLLFDLNLGFGLF